MITLFSEEVDITSTNSDRNIIYVESFEEAFFGVYQFEINGNIVIAEKVGQHAQDPVVAIPVVEANGSKSDVQFVLKKGPFEVQIGVGDAALLTESSQKEVVSPTAPAQIQYHLDKAEVVKEIKTDIDACLVEIRNENAASISEVDRIKDEIFIEFTSNSDNYRAKESEKLRAFVDSKLVEVREENADAAAELESKLAETLQSEFGTFVEKVKQTQQDLKKRALENRKITASISALEEGQVELNNELAVNKEEILEATETSQKNVNKALSRLGTVKKELTDAKAEFDILKEAWANDVNMEEVKAIRESAETHVKAYFDNKIEQVKEVEIDKLKKEEIFEALKESKETILEEITTSSTLKRQVYKLAKEVNSKVDTDTVTEQEVRKIAGEIIALTVEDDKASRITQSDVHSIVNEAVSRVVAKQPIVENAQLDSNTKKQITENLKIELDNRFGAEMQTVKRMIELAGGGGGFRGIEDAPLDGQTYARENGEWVISSGGGGGAVSKIVAGDNVTISPTGGVGNVTINATNTGSDVSTLSANWQGTYTTVDANSANWDTAYTAINAKEDNWDSAYSTVQSSSASWAGGSGGSYVGDLSGNWQEAYDTTSALSAGWSSNYTTTNDLSARWSGTASTVQSNSANWNEVGSDVSAISGVWEGTYSTMQANSGDWESAYSTVQSNSASWTGGGGGGVTEIIAGNNITIDQGTGAVTINATADGIGSDVSTISANWQNTYTTVDANSANWETAYTAIDTKEAIWDSTNSTMTQLSATWQGTYTTVDANSATWESAYSNVAANSGTWDNTYNTTRDLSASWSSAYDQVSALSAQWGGGTYDSGLASNIAMTEDVGGLSTGTTVASLTGQSFSQLFDTMLFPTVDPVVGSNNSTSLTDNVSNLQTIGATINITLGTSAGLGTLRLNGVTQGDYAGAVTAASISGPGGPYTLGVGPGDTDIDNQTVSNHVVTEGSNSWSMTTTFGEGPMPLDSAGNDFPSIRFAAGGTRSSSTSFEGVYPIKLGTSSGASSFEDRALTSHSSNNIEISQAYSETVSIRHRVAIPDDMIDAQTVGFQQWSTVSSSYSDIDASEFSSSSTTFTIEGNTVNYTLYTKTGPPGGGDVSGQPLYRITFS